MNRIQGNIIDIPGRNIFFGELEFGQGRITAIRALSDQANSAAPYICPGFIDAHVHIESSLLVPVSFARLAVVHGTVATVSDPHEIANVCGMDGVLYMIDNSRQSPFKFHFGAPSCVPATGFETAGDSLDAGAVEQLLQRNDIYYLSEMMNFPGVLHGDEEVFKKIGAAQKLGKPVDGHAPGLRGNDARRYIAAGISTDHECFTEAEAREKLGMGMKILIREGSAARNFDALVPLLETHADQVMFCTDDKHPDSLLLGHINQLCARAVEYGIDVFNVLQAACLNPALHYKMNVGLLRNGDPADFIVIDDLVHFHVLQTWIDGIQCADNGSTLLPHRESETVNRFYSRQLSDADFRLLPAVSTLPVIGALESQLITEKIFPDPAAFKARDGWLVSNPGEDLLKCFVINRYHEAPVAGCFIRGFNLQKGAIASTVAHDSHNIIVVGVDDTDICRAVNLLMEARGGLSCVTGNEEAVLPLPVGGLMSTADGYSVAAAYTRIDEMAKSLGTRLQAPFMTLSFMALLVIPHIKLSDKGLFDGDSFRFFHLNEKV